MPSSAVRAHASTPAPTPRPLATPIALGLGGAPATAEQDHEGPGEEVGDDDVEHGREAEEEGEALHRPDRELVEHEGAEQRHEVGGQHGAEGALEAPVDAGAHRASRPRLVLQSFEVDDVGVHGDTDRHDDADDAGQVDGGVEGLAHPGDDRPQQGAGDGEAGHDHQAEQPVVEDRVDHDQASRPMRPEMRPACSDDLPSDGDTVWTVCWSSLTGRAP